MLTGMPIYMPNLDTVLERIKLPRKCPESLEKPHVDPTHHQKFGLSNDASSEVWILSQTSNNFGISSSIPSTMTRTNRTVRFSDYEQVQEVDSFIEAGQKDALWYSRQDLLDLRQHQGQDPDGCDDCESFFSTCGEQVQKNFVAELLRQQNEHRLLGMMDPKGLFQLSRSHSKKARINALKTAKSREQQVQIYLATTKAQLLCVLDDALDLLEESL